MIPRAGRLILRFWTITSREDWRGIDRQASAGHPRSSAGRRAWPAGAVRRRSARARAPRRCRGRAAPLATPVLYERGLDGIGVAELCAGIGVSKETLYRHFGTKDGLVQAMLEARSERVTRWLAEAATAAGSNPADPRRGVRGSAAVVRRSGLPRLRDAERGHPAPRRGRTRHHGPPSGPLPRTPHRDRLPRRSRRPADPGTAVAHAGRRGDRRRRAPRRGRCG
ncbi:MAG: TetR/AcrR family transcriptional regulator [Actinoallomurus sp.]